MRLIHKTPCNECPWRRNSPPGWLGGNTAEHYADIVAMNHAPPCHNRDHGPHSNDTALCVGALATASNSCIALENREEQKARVTIGKREDCFSSPSEFYEHHTHGEKYRTRLERLIAGQLEVDDV